MRKVPVGAYDAVELVDIQTAGLSHQENVLLWLEFLYNHSPFWIWRAFAEGKVSPSLQESIEQFVAEKEEE